MRIAMVSLPCAAIVAGALVVWAISRSSDREQRERARSKADKIFEEAQGAIEQDRIPRAQERLEAYLADANGSQTGEAEALLAEIRQATAEGAAARALDSMSDADFAHFRETHEDRTSRLTRPRLIKMWEKNLLCAMPQAVRKREDARLQQAAEEKKRAAEAEAAAARLASERAALAAAEARRRQLDTIASLRDGKQSPSEAAHALAQGGPKVVPDLVRLLGDREPRVIKCAVIALGIIGPDARQAVPRLIGVLNAEADLRLDTAAALENIGPDARASVRHLFRTLGAEPSADRALGRTINAIDPEAGRTYYRLRDLEARLGLLGAELRLAEAKLKQAELVGDINRVRASANEIRDVAREQLRVIPQVEEARKALLEWK